MTTCHVSSTAFKLNIFQERSVPRGWVLSLSNFDHVKRRYQYNQDTGSRTQAVVETLSYSFSDLVVWLTTSVFHRDADSEVIWSEVQSLKETRAAVNLENIHVEDGPIFLRINNTCSVRSDHKTKETLSMIDAELNNRYFHKQDELERLREDTVIPKKSYNCQYTLSFPTLHNDNGSLLSLSVISCSPIWTVLMARVIFSNIPLF